MANTLYMVGKMYGSFGIVNSTKVTTWETYTEMEE